jgi:hypothetical protein
MHRPPRRPDRSLAGAVLALLCLCTLVALAAAGPQGAAAQEPAFVAGIEDLPLMPQLDEVAEAGVVFDKPSGRIVESYAEGATTRAQVEAFYRRTLPQLGWLAVDRGGEGGAAFLREGERLVISFLGRDGDLVVRFTLQPE